MSEFYAGLFATPFHPRTAERNVENAWVERGAFTLPRHFGNVAREAVAARYSAALADMSAFGRLRVYGPGAARLLSSACKSDLGFLAPGAARNVLWKNDKGALRGFGTVARFGEENFVLESADTDFVWFNAAANRFGARVRDERGEKGVLLLAGPLASSILDMGGLSEATKLEPQHHGVYDWRGLPLTVSRRASHGGFELGCSAADAIAVFDRILAVGKAHALTPIGQDALELLFLEAGIPLPGLDFLPARDAEAEVPLAESLGLKEARADAAVLIGLEWDGQNAASFASLYRKGRRVGRTLRSAYSPTLRRVIALAQVEPECAMAEGEFVIPSVEQVNGDAMRARVSTLPFLKIG